MCAAVTVSVLVSRPGHATLFIASCHFSFYPLDEFRVCIRARASAASFESCLGVSAGILVGCLAPLKVIATDLPIAN
jgi:hypothetical protein